MFGLEPAVYAACGGRRRNSRDPGDGHGGIVNLTSVGANGPGFITAYPCGPVPATSNLNMTRVAASGGQRRPGRAFRNRANCASWPQPQPT